MNATKTHRVSRDIAPLIINIGYKQAPTASPPGEKPVSKKKAILKLCKCAYINTHDSVAQYTLLSSTSY